MWMHSDINNAWDSYSVVEKTNGGLGRSCFLSANRLKKRLKNECNLVCTISVISYELNMSFCMYYICNMVCTVFEILYIFLFITSYKSPYPV